MRKKDEKQGSDLIHFLVFLPELSYYEDKKQKKIDSNQQKIA